MAEADTVAEVAHLTRRERGHLDDLHRLLYIAKKAWEFRMRSTDVQRSGSAT